MSRTSVSCQLPIGGPYLPALLGHQDRHLRLLRDAFGIRVVMRGDVLTLEGEEEPVRSAAEVLNELLESLQQGESILTDDVERAISTRVRSLNSGEQDTGADVSDMRIEVFIPGRVIRPRTRGQADYVRNIQVNDLVFCVGPAGTGKTYLAVAMAVAALKQNAVRRIILIRPAVEAGESLGFLPGDMQAKVNPYLRPLYDALNDMMSHEQVRRYMENDLLEVAPLAYMRGRTLDHAFIILDEGQNCTSKQMKMFLTRLGASSKSVVTGDVSQTDLPPNEVSGMKEATGLLRGVKGIGCVRLTRRDIVRHRLVQDIVDAYDLRNGAVSPDEKAQDRFRT